MYILGIGSVILASFTIFRHTTNTAHVVKQSRPIYDRYKNRRNSQTPLFAVQRELIETKIKLLSTKK